jgi:U3 small nucleolar ribonucleoprotein protein IMP3
MRQLKHHEKKLLKRVDFLQWKNEHNLRELQVQMHALLHAALSDERHRLEPNAACGVSSVHALCILVVQVMRRYHIQDRDDYKKYNKLCGMVTKVTSIIKKLDARDVTRIELTDQLLDKCAVVLL